MSLHCFRLLHQFDESMTEPETRGEWTRYFSQDNKPYYHNSATGETTWDTPDPFKDASASIAEWVEYVAEDGTKYYYNTRTKVRFETQLLTACHTLARIVLKKTRFTQNAFQQGRIRNVGVINRTISVLCNSCWGKWNVSDVAGTEHPSL